MIRQIHLVRLPPPRACARVAPALSEPVKTPSRHGLPPRGPCLAAPQTADVQHEPCTPDGTVVILQYVHTGIITAELGVNVQAIWVQEGSSVYLGARTISLPEMPDRAATKGDFVVIYVRQAGIYVGRVTDEGNGPGTGETPKRMYGINLERYFRTRWSLPRDLWTLFSVQPQLISDPHQVALLNEVIAGARTANTSHWHILFDELADPHHSPVIADLVLIESMQTEGSGVSFCDACKMGCTELLEVDLLDAAIDREWFIPWSALTSFQFQLREALDDGWLERTSGENNLDLARRYLEVLLGDWTNDVETPILFGLRRGVVERWSWILVAFAADGEHPSSIDRAFASRADAESYLPILGCRTSADLGTEQLKSLGVTDPDGHTL